jgi:hypothetical protein
MQWSKVSENVEMIQPLMSNVSKYFSFRPPGGQAKNQIGPKFVLRSYRPRCMYKISVSGLPPDHNPSITKCLTVPMPGFEPNLCLNEKGGIMAKKSKVIFQRHLQAWKKVIWCRFLVVSGDLTKGYFLTQQRVNSPHSYETCLFNRPTDRQTDLTKVS